MLYLVSSYFIASSSFRSFFFLLAESYYAIDERLRILDLTVSILYFLSFFFYIHAQCFLVIQAQWPPSSVDAYIALYSSPHARLWFHVDHLCVRPFVVLPSVVLFPNDN